jgi:hypothetical protein
LAGLGDVDPPHWGDSIGSSRQLLLQLAQESVFAIFAYCLDADSIHTGCPSLGFHAPPGLLKRVQSTDLIVE